MERLSWITGMGQGRAGMRDDNGTRGGRGVGERGGVDAGLMEAGEQEVRDPPPVYSRFAWGQ